MPGQMMSNYLGKALYGMGRGSSAAYMAARKGADIALANSIAKYAVPAGLGMAGAYEMSQGHPMIGAAMMGAGAYVGARGMSSGSYGSMGGWGGAGGKMAGYKSRLRERMLGTVGSYSNTPMGSFRSGFFSF